MTPESALVLAGPLVGARRTRGARRWLVLAATRVVVLLLCGLITEAVFAGGNSRAAKLRILYALALALYYPLLAIAWLIRSRAGPRHDRHAAPSMNTA